MQIFKSQKLMLSLMALSIFIVLLAFGYMRITPKIIDLPTYNALLSSGAIQKAKVENDEVFLYGINDCFVIIKDGIDISELLQKVPVEVARSNALIDDMLIIALLLGGLLALLLFARKKSKKTRKKHTPLTIRF